MRQEILFSELRKRSYLYHFREDSGSGITPRGERTKWDVFTFVELPPYNDFSIIPSWGVLYFRHQKQYYSLSGFIPILPSSSRIHMMLDINFYKEYAGSV